MCVSIHAIYTTSCPATFNMYMTLMMYYQANIHSMKDFLQITAGSNEWGMVNCECYVMKGERSSFHYLRNDCISGNTEKILAPCTGNMLFNCTEAECRLADFYMITCYRITMLTSGICNRDLCAQVLNETHEIAFRLLSTVDAKLQVNPQKIDAR